MIPLQVFPYLAAAKLKATYLNKLTDTDNFIVFKLNNNDILICFRGSLSQYESFQQLQILV